MPFIKRVINKLNRIIKGTSAQEVDHMYLKEHGLREGEHVDCFSWSGFDAQYPGLITLGNYITIAGGCRVLAHDASIGYATRATRIGQVIIEDHCFIGADSTIMPNVRIGEWSVVAAGSLVNKNIPPHEVWGGVPAHFIASADDFYKKHEQGLHEKYVLKANWRDVANFTDEQWADLRAHLDGEFGYVTARKDL